MSMQQCPEAGGCREGRMSCVAVYCGASEPKNPIFNQKAEELGIYLARQGIAVVYGGGNFGVMGKMANGVLNNGGKLTGYIPKFFTEYKEYIATGEEVVVPDMHTRKKMIFEKAEGFIALPGGIGTMEELTEMMTWSGLDLHSKPIALLNTEGYYDHFLAWVKRALEEGFIPAPPGSGGIDDLLVVSREPKELVEALSAKIVK